MSCHKGREPLKLQRKAELEHVPLINARANAFASIAEKAYYAHREAFAEYECADCVETRLRYSMTAREQGTVSIVMFGMALEAALYTTGMYYFSKTAYSKADRAPVMEKWCAVIEGAYDFRLQEDGTLYKAIKQVVQARNELVHSKSEVFRREQIDEHVKKHHPRLLAETATTTFQNYVRICVALEALSTDLESRPVFTSCYNADSVPLERSMPESIWAEIVAVRESMSDAEY